MDFPLDPVTAIIFGVLSKSCQLFVANERKNKPISLSIGIPKRIASAIATCGSGYKCGIPGEVIKRSMPSRPPLIGSTHLNPFSRARSRPSSSSSQHKTFAPPANEACAATKPERAIPKIRTVRPLTP